MNKKPGAAAVIVAVLVSILLFPFILVTGFGSGAVFSAAAVIEPGREDQIFDTFLAEGGLDGVYDEIINEAGSTFSDLEQFGISLEEFLPKSDLEYMLRGMFEALMSEQRYAVDLTAQRNYLDRKMDEYFEANIDSMIREEAGEYYDHMTEEQKEEAKVLARNEFATHKETELLVIIDELEAEVSGIVNSVYETEEYAELKALEAETGYSFFERTKLHGVVEMAGYILLGAFGFFLFLLLLSYLFRPAGFFVGGAYSLFIGGILKLAAMAGPDVINIVIMEELAMPSELPTGVETSVAAVLSEVFAWCLEGLNKVGAIGLWTGMILVLIGVLLVVLRRNAALAANE